MHFSNQGIHKQMCVYSGHRVLHVPFDMTYMPYASEGWRTYLTECQSLPFDVSANENGLENNSQNGKT